MSVLLYYAAMTAAAAQELELGLWTGLKQVYAQMTRQRRRQFAAVLALMLAGGLAELATIGSVVPFLGLLSQPGATMALPWPVPMLGALGERIGVGAVTAAALVFAGFAVIAGLVRLLLTRATQDFIYRLGQELMLEAQRRILLQPYPFYMERNTSTLISSIEKVEIFVLALLLPLMQMLTAAVLAAFIVAALLVVDQVTAIVAAAVFSGVYLLVSALTRKRLAANSAVLKTAYNERLKIAQESLGGIRDVILENSQSMHLALFDRVNGRLARARATTAFISTAPRYIIETAGIVAIAAMALLISARDGGVGLDLPILGAIALGAQRLLPLLQQIYAGWSNSAGYLSLIGQVVEFLRLPVPPRAGSDRANPLPFNDRITLEGVSFGYVSRPKSPALESVTFDIRRGEMIALTGETGCGKSTLADLLMGLLQPSEGRICVDSAEITPANARRWQQNVAHVPQSIFLADTTIGRNIALSPRRRSARFAAYRRSGANGQGSRFHRDPAAGVRHSRRRARSAPFRRPAPAAGPRPRHLQAGTAPGARRSNQRAG